MLNRVKFVANLIIVNIGLIVLALLFFELLAFAAIEIKGFFHKGDASDFPPKYRQAAYSGDIFWVSQHLLDEKRAIFDIQEILYRPAPLMTATIKVHEALGARHSCCTECKRKDAKKAFVFGGSTMWGVGVKDEFTIPPFLNQISNSNLIFYNFGIPSYKSAQEVLRLETLLMDGYKPDIEIFYHGANDIFSVFLDNELLYHAYTQEQGVISKSLSSNIVNIIRLTNLYKIAVSVRSRIALAADGQSSASTYTPTPADIAALNHAIDRYRKHVRHARAVARAYGIRIYFFLQPYLATGLERDRAALTDYELNLYRTIEARHKYLVNAFYWAVRDTDGIIDISAVFAEPRLNGNYDDAAHLNPLGNQRVARRIYAELK